MERILVYGMTANMGGIETYLLNLYDRLHGKKVMIDFLSDFPKIIEENKIKSEGSRVFHIPAKSKGLFSHWKALFTIFKEHTEYKTVYFNILDAGAVLTCVIPFFMKRKIIIHSHNNETDKTKLHRMCKPILNLITYARVACSEEASYYMFGRRGMKSLVIPNAIDAKKYTYNPNTQIKKRAELKLGDKLTICHVGRLSRQKNPFFLIDIMEKLQAIEPNVVLLSIGTGELEEQFHQYIHDKNMDNIVMCLGMRQDIPDLLQASDIFLFPSLYEGFGIALVEAQAAGLPCIISDVIPDSAVILKEIVKKIGLNDSLEIWIDSILKFKNNEKRDTYDCICKAGFDISCIEEYDKKLLEYFVG